MATPNHYSSPQDDPLTMHRFSTHVAWTFATRIVMIVSSVGASVIVARWLGPEGFGTLAVINVTVAVALQLGSAGLPSANTYFIARDKSRLGAIWANALVFGIVIGSILTLVVILLFNLKPSLFGYVWFPLIVIGAAAIPFQLISLLGLNVFLGMNRIVNFNVLDAASQSFVLLNAAIVWMTHRMLSLVRDGQPFRIDLRLFRKMARYGIKFHVAVVAAMLIFRADLLIVNHFRSTSEVGVYAVASQVATLLMLLPGVIGTLLLPRVASSVDEGGAITMRVTRHTAFIMLLICLAAAPSSFLIPYIYGAEFNTATLLFLILLPGIFLIGIESVLVQYFSSIGLPVAIPVFWIITLGLNVALNLMFVPVFGARAAAVVSSISYALIFSLVISYFRVKTGNSLSETILIRRGELRDLLRTLAAAKRVQ
jgi:O-antigen/teichoic acid export membrane protein